MDLGSHICFLCTTEFQDTKSKLSTQCGGSPIVLCQILDLSHIDLDQYQHKFDKVLYCSSCSDKITKITLILEKMEKLEREVLQQKFEIELKLKENCMTLDEQNETLNAVMEFRNEIVMELRSKTIYSMLGNIYKKHIVKKTFPKSVRVMGKIPIQRLEATEVTESTEIRKSTVVTENRSPSPNCSDNYSLKNTTRILLWNDTISKIHVPDSTVTPSSILENPEHDMDSISTIDDSSDSSILDEYDPIEDLNILEDGSSAPDLSTQMPFNQPEFNTHGEVEVEISEDSTIRQTISDSPLIKQSKTYTVNPDKIIKPKRRIRIPPPKIPQICEECGKTLGDTKSLRVHIVRVHRGGRYPCKLCIPSYGYNTPSELSWHMAAKHSDERNFICDKCSKTFKIKRNLDVHMRIHNGSRPYKCTLCPAACNKPIDLRNHMLTHSEEKLFKCDVCPSSFKQKRNLIGHLRRCHIGRELEYNCKQCSARFKDSNRLYLHEMKHQGENPEICSICNKKFSHKSSLKKHMRRHEKHRESEICMNILSIT